MDLSHKLSRKESINKVWLNLVHTEEHLTLFRLGFLRVAQLGRGGGVPAACNSKTINENEMKFGGVVKDH